MNDRELLEKIASNMELLNNNMSGLEQRMSGLEQRMSGLEQSVSGLEQSVSGLEQSVSGLKKSMIGLEQRMSFVEESVETIKCEVKEIKITLENETNPNLLAIAEGHLDLVRDLRQAITFRDEKEMLEIRTNVLQSDVNKLKEWRNDMERRDYIHEKIMQIARSSKEANL